MSWEPLGRAASFVVGGVVVVGVIEIVFGDGFRLVFHLVFLIVFHFQERLKVLVRLGGVSGA